MIAIHCIDQADFLQRISNNEQIRRHLIQKRVAYGSECYPHEWPWVVRIASKGNPSESLCGGVLISRQVVLTAAHCLPTTSTYEVVSKYAD